jgi:hypothetical protein
MADIRNKLNFILWGKKLNDGDIRLSNREVIVCTLYGEKIKFSEE